MAETKRKKVSVKKQKKDEASEDLSITSNVVMAVHSNKSKQIGKTKRKKLDAQVLETIPSSSKPSKGGSKSLNISTNFHENEEVVTMEVEGMDVEFVDETGSQSGENSSHSDSDDLESELDSQEMGDINNSASIRKEDGKKKQLNIGPVDSQEDCDSEADTVQDNPVGLISLNLDDPEPGFGEQEAILFAKWEKYMKQKGLIKVADTNRDNNVGEGQDEARNQQRVDKDRQVSKTKERLSDKGKFNSINLPNCSPSESTIYKPAVTKHRNNEKLVRTSSSSEECESNESKGLDSSEENIESMIHNFVGSQRLALDEIERKQHLEQMDRRCDGHGRNHDDSQVDRNQMLRRVEEGADDWARTAERSKARIFEVSGNVPHIPDLCTSSIDEDFMLLAVHIDENLAQKIAQGEYVNFAKLIQKDKLAMEEDNRLELVNRGGCSFWVPVSEREVTSITSISRWDQAFRVYLKIYTKANPTRAEELVEYSFVIHSASEVFSWPNVYFYDKLFRLHLAKHPQRNWGIILQQAWSFCLTEKIPQNQKGNNFSGGGKYQDTSKKKGKICFDYNAGNCTYGFACKFDHRCGICGKFGHGAFNCRRADLDNRYKGKTQQDRWHNNKTWENRDRHQQGWGANKNRKEN